MSIHGADSLRFDLVVPTEARLGTPVPITLRLTNVSSGPVDAYFLGRDIAFDVVVTDEGGAVVWQRLAGRTVPSILQVRTLAAGEAMEWRDEWRPAAPGRYQVEGVLPSDAPAPRRSAPVTVTVR